MLQRLSFLIWLWLLIPILLLVYSQMTRPTTGLEIRQKLAVSLPTNEEPLCLRCGSGGR